MQICYVTTKWYLQSQPSVTVFTALHRNITNIKER